MTNPGKWGSRSRVFRTETTNFVGPLLGKEFCDRDSFSLKIGFWILSGSTNASEGDERHGTCPGQGSQGFWLRLMYWITRIKEIWIKYIVELLTEVTY